MKKRKICILGATGSIGTQSLDIVRKKRDLFEVQTLTTNVNIELLEKQCVEFNPKNVVISDLNSYNRFKEITTFKGNILFGTDALQQVASDKECDLIISSLVGFAGVLPTLRAIEAGIDVAIANKETLVSAGKIITDAAKKNNVNLLPIDSEHNAILQSIVGEKKTYIEKLILTASGGPFFNLDKSLFSSITTQQALNHPNWKMGNKVTIDSATMMNKGFEVMEAYWLFGIDINRIDVLIHPQSIIHSLVQFIDGSVKAQLGMPDMRIPISFALNYPNRFYFDFKRLDLSEICNLQFFKPDLEKFVCLKIAFEAIKKGGNCPAIVNAANEIAVNAFISEKIKFIDIPKYIELALQSINFIDNPSLDDILETDRETRAYLIGKSKTI
ncbi:MAG: 1-deoxy-D-xylulose-5-phosphate reductoisomerase [Bacteroidetes bacterium]|nr:1-deoxy-D-xylulose-5-phosphate reductoisomerase [Bacteroidota bacterium]